jgi:hypothetical protein
VYKAVCQAPLSAALCPAAAPATCQDVPAHADPGECRWASLRAVVQRVDSQANSPFHQGHRTAVCTVFPDHQAAWDALAGRDVVLRQSVVRFQASFQELVRDCPSATGEKAQSVALQALQQPDG